MQHPSKTKPMQTRRPREVAVDVLAGLYPGLTVTQVAEKERLNMTSLRNAMLAEKKKLRPCPTSLPASPSRDQLMAGLVHQLQQQVLSDAEMRRHGYSEKAIRA